MTYRGKKKNYLTRGSIKAPNQGPPGKADKGESPSFQFRFWVNIFCPQFKSFSQKRLFCSSTIWDFPFMYCRMFSSWHRHQQQASKRGKKIHQNEIHLSLAQFSYLNFFNYSLTTTLKNELYWFGGEARDDGSNTSFVHPHRIPWPKKTKNPNKMKYVFREHIFWPSLSKVGRLAGCSYMLLGQERKYWKMVIGLRLNLNSNGGSW